MSEGKGGAEKKKKKRKQGLRVDLAVMGLIRLGEGGRKVNIRRRDRASGGGGMEKGKVPGEPGAVQEKPLFSHRNLVGGGKKLIL